VQTAWASSPGNRCLGAGIQPYTSAKAGLVNLTRQLCHEPGSDNCSVNCIAPGFVRSNPSTDRQWQFYGEAGQQRLLENIAWRRLGTAQNIANGVLFFACEMTDGVSGQVLSVDRGSEARGEGNSYANTLWRTSSTRPWALRITLA
jgi:3-oxoacyl-[acyl-carrier protein] reductase